MGKSTITYIHVEPWMMKSAKLKGNDLIIFALINSFSQGNGGVCTLSYIGFADVLGTSESRVRAAFKKLEGLNYIKNTKLPGVHHSYISLISEKSFPEEPLESVEKTARIGRDFAKKPLESVDNTNIYNTNIYTNPSSDEDIDSDESIKEQETDSTELNKDVGMNSLMNNIGMTRASDMNNEFLTSWMEDEPKDISDRKDMSKSNKSPKGEERKSSAGKKERKAPNTPASRLYGFYRSLVERLVASGRIAPMQFAEGFKAVNAEYGKLKKTLLARMTEEDAAEYLEYVSHDDWILDNIGFPLDYILSERTIVNKYNRMMQERKKRQEEYIPPAVKISRAICSKCGNELFFDGTCSFCELENYKK